MSSLRDKNSRKVEALVAPPLPHHAEVVIATLVGVRDDGTPLVNYPDNPAGGPVPALATARYDDVPSGRPVALMFLNRDPARPLAIGMVAQADFAAGSVCMQDVEQSGERLMLSATREIVLQCGRASLVLTRAGKVLVRGAYVSLRSSGMHQITGASVQIN